MNDSLQRRAAVRVILPDIRQLLIDMLQRDRNGIIPLKRQPACNHFKHRNAEGIDIAFFVHITAPRLFRRKIMDRARGICRCRHGCRGRGSCNAEIRYFYHAICPHKDILGLDIPMYNMPFMRLRKRGRNLYCHIDGRAGVKRSFFLYRLFQRIPMNIFHNNKVYIIVRPNIIYPHDIWVGKLCR